MARYKYVGPRARPHLVKEYGPTVAVVLRMKDGTNYRVDAPDPQRGFKPGDDIPVDITDEHVIRAMDVDSRFQRVGG